jgi:predicted RNase H-like nuclease (RuvC/YqgF family)
MVSGELLTKQFEEIEVKVERLVEICKSLEAINFKLKNKIELLEKELQNKTDIEIAYEEERKLIRTKIDRLLARLEDIEEQK